MAPTRETLEISPTAGGSSRNGDLHVDKQKNGVGLFPELSLMVGRFNSGIFAFDFAGFLRFESPVPQGERIDGAGLSVRSNAMTAGLITTMVGGFIKPQAAANGRNWQKPNGVGEWLDSNDVPFGEWGFGANSDAAVWHDDAPAFSGQTIPGEPANIGIWSFGENVGSETEVPGMVAQLQAYLDANEALRGTGNDPNSIPVCFQFYRAYVVNGIENQGFFSSENGFVWARPKLLIDWSIANTAPVVSIATPPDGSSSTPGLRVDFSASSIDPEDGDISAGIVWSSDLDGDLGTGAAISSSVLSVGVHTIRATSVDAGGLSHFDEITLTIPALSPFASSIDARGATAAAVSSVESAPATVRARGQTSAELSAEEATSAAIDTRGRTRPALEGEE